MLIVTDFLWLLLTKNIVDYQNDYRSHALESNESIYKTENSCEVPIFSGPDKLVSNWA